MADTNEIEDRVDLDDDNYSDEDEDAEEQIDEEQMEDEGSEDDADENGAGESHDIRSEAHGEAMGAEKGDDGTEAVEGEEKPSAPINQEDVEKYAELLALPPHGSEIFVGGLSRDVTEEDLGDLCEPFGEIFEIRVMKNKETGESKGFAFVAFKTKDVAQKAIEELHGKDFKGKTLRCSLSETKYRLFIGNVPKSWTDDEFQKVINETGPGAETIELIKDPLTPSRNRGFAFIEYYNNACADYSRQKMSAASFKLDGNSPTVTWADPKITPDHSAAASQVKALYVKNIPENTPTEQLKELFQRHGEVTKVVMPPAKSGGKRDFGFVHYADRSSALKAVKDTEKYEVDGQVLEVVLAKPQAERKFDTAAPHSPAPLPNFIPTPSYGGFPVHPYASAPAGYGAATAGFQQPMIYGRGPMPTGMQMVPMMLPDGRIGYVLQQPGVQMPPASIRPRRNDRSNGKGGPSGRDDDAGHGRLPARQSLDHAVENRKDEIGKEQKVKKRSRGGKKLRERKLAAAARSAAEQEEPSSDVFSIINTHLAMHGQVDTPPNKRNKAPTEMRKEDRRSLIAYEDQIKELRTRVEKLEEMVSRNKNEKVVYEAAMRKLSETRKALAEAVSAQVSTSNAVLTKEKEKRWLKF